MCASSQDRVNLSVPRRRHDQDPEIVLYHLMSLPRAEERESLTRKRGSFWSSKTGRGRGGFVALVSGWRKQLGNTGFNLE